MKFLSIMSILIKKYIENNIMTIDERYLTENDILSYVKTLDSSIFYDILIETFDKRLTTPNIFNWCTKYEVSRFVILMYFMNMFDEFIESDEFNNFIEDIIKFASDVLYNNQYITKDFNWYECIDSLKLYFKSFLRYNLAEGQLFKSFIVNLNEDILYILQNSKFNYSYDTLREDFKSFYNNKLVSSNIHNFILNIYLGTVSKQVLYDVLKYYLI